MAQHPATFNSGDPNNIITLITGIAQLIVAIAPFLAQLFASFNQPTNPPAA